MLYRLTKWDAAVLLILVKAEMTTDHAKTKEGKRLIAKLTNPARRFTPNELQAHESAARVKS